MNMTIAACLAALLLSVVTSQAAHIARTTPDASSPVRRWSGGMQAPMTSSPRRVDVTIGVMSRCPDAHYFEKAFDRALDKVNDKIALTLTFIATPDDKAELGARCMHGEAECKGNIHQLCVINALNPDKAGRRYDISPSRAQRLWWEFVQCENFGGVSRIGDEVLVKECLGVGKVPKWDNDGIKDCIEGEKGKRLLQSSIDHTRTHDITKSATLQIEGKTVCVRDGGQWKECPNGHEASDWVRLINQAYEHKNGFAPESLDNRAARSPVRLARRDPSIVKRQSASPAPAPSNGQQGSGGGGDNQNQNQNQNQQGAPLSVFTFIIAIALFVLVVSFVLLRIFVRNRRLRRLGIYPEGPIERLLGTMPREYEDTLPPPKLWETKIADFRTSGSGITASGEKGTSGAATDTANVQKQGWDALMPLSAALPPSLYPIIYQAQDQGSSGTIARPGNQPQPLPPLSSSTGARLGRHMPQFLRRTTGDDVASGADAGRSAPQQNVERSEASVASEVAAAQGADAPLDERLSASVNVTVLIAMPSPKTVFPSTNKSNSATSSASNLRRSTSRLNNASGTFSHMDRLEDVDETADVDGDEQSLKGKTRRAPSVRSLRTVASTKSEGEARREAFFRAEESQEPMDLPLVEAGPHFSLEGTGHDEDEELPEIVFGTASVPLYSRITPSMEAPSRNEVLGLVASAAGARVRKSANKGGVNDDDKAAAKSEEEDAATIATRSQQNHPQHARSTSPPHANPIAHAQDSSSAYRSSDAFEMEDIHNGGSGSGQQR